jgi:uncharacterized protein (DUF433 family)
MSRINWKEFITIDPDLHHGASCITGTRVPVATIVGSLADGMSPDEVIASFPQLDEASVQAALAYAAEVMRQEFLIPFAS